MKHLALWLIKAYQVTLSPMLPPSCRYYPTCSRYAYTAIDRYGLLKGGLMAGWRLLRCNPWTVGGYDPVDDRDRAAHEAALAAYDAHEATHMHPR